MEPFPYLVDANTRDATWIAQNSAEIRRLLSVHGALLFRHFPLKDKKDFSHFVRTLAGPESLLDYTGGTSPRESLGDEIYTSTKMPFFLKIPMHSEMAYRKKFPKKVFFFCEKAPLFGGETPIVDTRKVYEELPVNLRKKIETQGIIYYRHLRNDTRIRKFFSIFNPMIETGTWQFVFKTMDPEIVEKYCRENSFLSKWQDDGSVILETHLPASFIHHDSQKYSWFNSLHFFQVHQRIWGTFITSLYKLILFFTQARDLNARTGDGQLLTSTEVSMIVEAYEKNTIAFPWNKGDVLFLDNTITAHGRNPYLGQRKILVALAEEGEFP